MWLIEQQRHGITQESLGNSHALTLSAGEHGAIALKERDGQPDLRQRPAEMSLPDIERSAGRVHHQIVADRALEQHGRLPDEGCSPTQFA